MCDVLKYRVFEVVGQELQESKENFFNHERLQVQKKTLKNVYELASEAQAISDFVGEMKEKNSLEDLHSELNDIYAAAIDLAVIAIDTAVMARKEIIGNIHLLNIDQGLILKS